ncbi:isocitrate lyase/phosphoenolpyruvate mutase family protein [Ectopseudomonas mendocina]|uniref:Isocitrate lyase/phosphoenolpyruvate mutase family protein n=1 Tax=Ectopseudomonas mendocina TaxID=300 RepID=A0ABZ2RJL4_ECTME
MHTHDSSFHALHKQGLLVLANVGDAGSARLVESLGSKAVATSSAAMAWANGYQDGNKLPLELLLSSVRSMTRTLNVPLTVDIEGGYSDDLAQVSKVIEGVIAAGAVGINLEDGSGSPELLMRKIETARKTANRLGVNLFINARCDLYLKNLLPADDRLDEALKRTRRYATAGADGFFIPGMTTPDEIAVICLASELPVNLLARDNLPTLEELQLLGVRRLSAGSSLAESLYGALAEQARQFLQQGMSVPGPSKPYTYRELNGLMAPSSTAH